MSRSSIRPAFRDPVRQSQTIFRSAMAAIARPGQIIEVAPGLKAPAPLSAPAACLLLTLCDFETSIWLDQALPANPAVAEFLRFHTGARCIAEPSTASGLTCTIAELSQDGALIWLVQSALARLAI